MSDPSSTLTDCSVCGAKVAADAPTCPTCGTRSGRPGPPDEPLSKKHPWVDLLLRTFVTALIFGVLLVPIANLTVQPWLEDLLKPADCTNPKDLAKVDLDPNKDVEATSVLPPERVTVPELGVDENGQAQTRLFTYRAGNLVDGDTGTAWSEDSKTGNQLGHGESVTLTFPQPVDVKLLCIVNGFAYSEDLYSKNARVRGLTINSGEARTQAVTLTDPGVANGVVFQPITLGWDDTSSLTLTIASTYAGLGRSRASDTLISEIEVWADWSPPPSATLTVSASTTPAD
jgi:hypothetical protein